MCLKRYFFVFIVTVGTQLCSGSSVDRWVIESFFNKQDVPVDSVEDVKEMLNYFASQQEQGNQQVIEEIEVHLTFLRKCIDTKIITIERHAFLSLSVASLRNCLTYVAFNACHEDSFLCRVRSEGGLL